MKVTILNRLIKKYFIIAIIIINCICLSAFARIPQEEKKDKDSFDITIRMVGDVLLHDGVFKSCQNEEGEYDFFPLFKNTENLVKTADIAIVNQEVIIAGKELRVSGYPSFNAPFELADTLTRTGFDVICHGTNHALDRGKKGIINCLEYWNKHYPDVQILGIHNNQESYDNIYIKEINGFKIAILNYTYGTNGIALPKDMPYAVSLLSEKKVLSDIEKAEEIADFTIVCPHWGIEYQLQPSKDQKSWALKMTEKGADLILGTHPHVIEPIEEIIADNGNKSVCYYSLGNYINWTSGRGKSISNRMIGGMSDTVLSINNGTICNVSAKVIPLVSHVQHENEKVTTYLFYEYTEELATKNAIIEQTSDFSIEYCKTLIDSIWDEKYIKGDL